MITVLLAVSKPLTVSDMHACVSGLHSNRCVWWYWYIWALWAVFDRVWWASEFLQRWRVGWWTLLSLSQICAVFDGLINTKTISCLIKLATCNIILSCMWIAHQNNDMSMHCTHVYMYTRLMSLWWRLLGSWLAEKVFSFRVFLWYSVCIWEVSHYSGVMIPYLLKAWDQSIWCMYGGAPLKSVLNSEVSSFQGLLNTQIRHLGLTKLSCLWRCPQFRGVHL